jgi:hypothetical protein
VWLAGLQALATVGAYALTNRLPFDSFAIAWDRRQLVYLAVYYLAAAVPFFFGGLIVGILLTGIDQPVSVSSHIVYGASLVGAGLGCIAAVFGLDLLGAEGTIVLAAIVAMAAAAGFAGLVEHRTRLVSGMAAITLALALVGIVAPGLMEMHLSPYKSLPAALRFPGSLIAATAWDQGTRIDLVHSRGIRSLPGLSLTSQGIPPPQDGVTFDGDDLSPVPRSVPGDTPYAQHMLTAPAWLVRPEADTLVLAPRGGLDVLIALAGGAASVTAVEPHGAVIDMISSQEESVYDDPRVTVVVDDPRAFVERTERRFDVIDLALTDPYRPVTSGAYSLTEDYRITVQAFESYLDRLTPDGILTAARWVQIPPSEETRLLGVAANALRNRGIDPATAVVMLRSYSNALLLVAPGGWPATDLATLRAFGDAQQFDIIAMPDLDPSETNRYNVIPDESYSALAAELLTTDDRRAFYAGYDFDITPPTDDHPFFGHYFKWGQTAEVLGTIGHTRQPFGGAGFLVLVAFVAIAVIASLVLILAPLVVRARTDVDERVPPTLRWWTVAYFGFLGLAFLLVEIPMIQASILLVGSPALAVVVVLFSVLTASGIGAVASPKIPWVAAGTTLAVCTVAYAFLTRFLAPVVLPAPFPVRVVAGAVAVAPLGFLMGTMFPHGITHIAVKAPRLVPWAWGINGTASVVAAGVAALLALTFGFTTVLLVAAAGYAAATVLATVAGPSPTGAGERHEHH